MTHLQRIEAIKTFFISQNYSVLHNSDTEFIATKDMPDSWYQELMKIVCQKKYLHNIIWGKTLQYSRVRIFWDKDRIISFYYLKFFPVSKYFFDITNIKNFEYMYHNQLKSIGRDYKIRLLLDN
jgi:hydroxymethylpyrimidine pyrophosphatase-like HAD family hydrolase